MVYELHFFWRIYSFHPICFFIRLAETSARVAMCVERLWILHEIILQKRITIIFPRNTLLAIVIGRGPLPVAVSLDHYMSSREFDPIKQHHYFVDALISLAWAARFANSSVD